MFCVMKIALLQQNFIVGDLEENSAKILWGYEEAVKKGATLVVSSELSIFGYPPRDLLENKELVERQLRITEDLAKHIGDVPLILGIAEPNPAKIGKPLFNSAAFLRNGKIRETRRKALLPTYDVFDEYRYFEPYTGPQLPISYNGVNVGILVCEDIWNGTEDPDGRREYRIDPVAELLKHKPDILVVINGSPYFWGKGDVRFRLLQNIAKKYAVPVYYSNQIGGNDELIFDGRSFAVETSGMYAGAAMPFREDIFIIDSKDPQNTPYRSDEGNLSEIQSALILGVRDYVEKIHGFPGGAVLGLSGGIDSALTAVIAVEALGAQKVFGVAMPSRYSSKESVEDAKKLAENLRIPFRIIPIDEGFKSYQAMLKPIIGWNDPPKTGDATEENIQARIRGMLLMAIANRERRIVLGTGNKSELAVGYATLYGDMAAGLGVISDLPKTLVYKLSEFINRGKEIIPQRIIEKPPSAELRPNQKDTDSLPPYDILDAILEFYVEKRMGRNEIIAKGFEEELVKRIIKMVNSAEFKRRQMAPGLKITGKAFGTGRRMPIAANVNF